jgi:Mg-chelatase subunit ChlD
MKTIVQKAVCAVLIQTLVGAQLGMAATAIVWPTPAPQQQAEPGQPLQQRVAMRPNFEAPSATNCQRPMQTREVSDGHLRTQPQLYGGPRLSEDAGDASRRKDAAVPIAALGGRALAAPAMPAPSSAAPRSEGKLAAEPLPAPAAAAMAESRIALSPVPYDALPHTPALQPPPQNQGPVTAGMVDDNAAFSDYLAFRQRSQVEHRARDVRERYLLEVNDALGRGVPDAEVAVQAANGATSWLRTDAAGKAWIHPDAFDKAHSRFYELTVRQGSNQASAVLQRGQKSAVEVRLGQARAPQQARLDLVFLVDATGSMGDEIDKLKSSLRSITDEVARLPSHPDLCLGLVAYRDRGDAFFVRSHDLTHDVSAFQGVLNALQAAGGGDEPEAMNEALHEAVHHISWRGEQSTRLLVLVADAPPHLDYGGPQYDEDMMAALGKGIKLMAVGASGLNPQGEYIQRQMAQYTGGRFIFLTYADASNPASGPGRETVHDVRNYSVQTLDKLIVRLVREELDKLPRV